MKTKSKTGRMVRIALLASVLAVLSQIILPIGPVPFSLALLGVFFIGSFLPPADASICIAVYLALGMFGLPVFAGFKGGPQTLLGPTGGYLLGYYAITIAVALAHRYGRSIWTHLAAALGGLALCYLFGTLWFMLMSKTPLLPSLAMCVFPFIIPDIAKAVGAILLARALKARMGKGAVAG